MRHWLQLHYKFKYCEFGQVQEVQEIYQVVKFHQNKLP